MAFIEDILTYDFMQRALLASLLSGISCGIVGSYIVSRRMVFLSGGITHASFGGLGIALYGGFSPTLGAMLAAILSALGIEFASRRVKLREDSAIGIIWSLGMALGALFMSLRPGYASDLTSYLFGNILLVDRSDIALLALLTAIIVIGAITLLRRIMYITFDEDYARSQGMNVTLISYVMAVVVALAIVLSIKVMGIILLMSLLTLPTVIANTLTKDFSKIALLSAIIGVVGNIVGFVLSYNFDLPTGSCIIFTLTLALICVKLLSLHSKRAKA
ncbi:MAG: metal ABC transporter permease [Alistipes sp.]|nr:metal ABC transporter permease [Alistipes sp.]MBQ6940860.1 metal ABC transporter permease [Alistipes sp.]